MFELSKLDLELAFETLGPQGKDIEDQGRPILTSVIQPAFEVTLLTGAQLVIEDHDVPVVHRQGSRDLLDLARTCEQGRIRRASPPLHNCHGFSPGGPGKQLQLGQAFGLGRLAEIQLDEDGTIAGRIRTIKHEDSINRKAGKPGQRPKTPS